MSATEDLDIIPMDLVDPALIVHINNASMPEDTWISEEEVRIWEGLQAEGEPQIRYVAWRNERPVGLGAIGRSIFSPSGRYGLGILVIPDSRRKGIASSLYQQLLRTPHAARAEALRVDVHQSYVPAAEAWLAREGYVEIERMRPSELRLDEACLEQWQKTEERTKSTGIGLTTLAAEDSEGSRRKLWEVSERTRADVPHHGPFEPFPFEQFSELLNRPEARPALLVIAKDGDSYVGFTMLVHQTPERALTGMTGVLPEYRNRGIALAMKVRCARLARDAGYAKMRTFNHVNNPSMLKVNDRMGYVALPHEVLFEKTMASGTPE